MGPTIMDRGGPAVSDPDAELDYCGASAGVCGGTRWDEKGPGATVY